jgi:hypothetical protein
MDDRVSIPGRDSDGVFLFATASRPTLGLSQPPIQCVAEAFTPEVKRQGREADHSSPSSAEVKNAWSYTSTPPIRLHGVTVTLPFPPPLLNCTEIR